MKKLLLAIILLALPAFAAEKVPHISQRQLDSMVRYWQHVLSLDDWEVRAHAVRFDKLPDGSMGYSERGPDLRVMRIAVLDPADYALAASVNGSVPKHGKEVLRDIEDTVVHELMHLRLRELKDSDKDGLEMAEEVTVNRVTSALLRARHRR